MTIPKYKELYSNVLSLFSNEKEEYKTRYIKKVVSDSLNLSSEERNFLKNGTSEPLVEYNLGWTLTYLKKAGLLESKRRGYINITELGLKEIRENPKITEKDLYKFPSFVEFKRGDNKQNDTNQSKLNDLTPEDQIKNIIIKNNLKICTDMVNIILKSNILVFKKLIYDLLLKLDYNEIELDNDSNTVKGIVYQDKLGLDKIAINAVNKKDEINVSNLQSFAGFIVSNGLTKGIYITSSRFNESVIEYVKNQTNLTIILIDGKRLSKLMLKYDLGTSIQNFEVKHVDFDYFK